MNDRVLKSNRFTICLPHINYRLTEISTRISVSADTNGTRLVQMVWILIVAAASITSYTGNARPYIEPSQLPGGTSSPGTYLFGAILVVGFGGAAVIALASGDKWAGMAEQTNLTLEDSGVTGKGTYAGTIDSRHVRARIDRRKTGGQTEGGSSHTSYTITEADLDSAFDDGIILMREPSPDNRMDVEGTPISQTVIDGEFVLTGVGSEQFARDILTQDVRNAVRGVEGLETLTIGDASELVAETLPSIGDSGVSGFLQGKFEQAMTSGVGGSPTTVGIETEGVLGDANELNNRIAAVGTVANAFEDARSR